MKNKVSWKWFCLFFIPSMLLGGGLITNVYQNELKISRTLMERQEQYELSADAKMIRSELLRTISDLKYLASKDLLVEALVRSDLHLKEKIIREFIDFSEPQARYDQLRLISSQGMEMIRVHFSKETPEKMRSSETQLIEESGDFIETFRLDAEQIYISPFEIDQEAQHFDEAFSAVIRFGTPLFDQTGQKKGILLLDLKADRLFNQMYKVESTKDEEHMLINGQGDWIFSSNSRDELGFVLPDPRDRKFEKTYPGVWDRIQRKESGTFYTNGGLFTYRTIDLPVVFRRSNSGKFGKGSLEIDRFEENTRFWKIISFVSVSELTAGPKKIRDTLLLFYVLYLGTIGISSVFLSRAVIHRKKSSRSLEERETRIQGIIESAYDGIITIALTGEIESMNPAALHIFGYGLEEVIGQRIEMLMPKSFRRFHQYHIDEKFKEDLEVNGTMGGEGRELSGLRKDGSTFPLEISLSTGQQDGVQYVMGILRDITERNVLEKEMRRNAFYDSLTHLPNRVLILDRLSRCIKQADRREDYHFAVLFLDLDRFKAVNDSLGHAVGDQLLIGIAKRLTNCVRTSDTIARLGGDEMGILLEDICDIHDATMVAERVLRTFQKPFHIEGSELLSSISIGIALSATRYETPEEIMRDADIAMYRAKTSGRGHYEVFDVSMREQIIARNQFEKDLRNAVVSDEFVLHYQPIVSLESGEITHFEALVRWRHPERGMVPPEQFIPLAEETGLIIDIGDIVLRTACRQAAFWQSRYLPEKGLETPIGMSINLSAKQLRQANFIRKMSTLLRETKCDPKTLKIEITETLLMENVDVIQNTLLDLKNMNIQLYIDDFGVGYSSLSYLHQFPFDALKIDRSFTMGIGVDETKMKIVTTLLSLSAQLGLDVIAEGIETAQQLEVLQGLSCKYGQGYYFSKPIDAEAATTLLEQAGKIEKADGTKCTV